VQERQADARVENDPLLAFSFEPRVAAAPPQLEQPVAAVRVPASAPSDRKTSDSADAMRARIDRLEKVVDRNTKEINALKSQVATLVGARENKHAGTISAIVALVVGVGLGAWLWTLMSSEPLLTIIGKPPLAAPVIVHAASVMPAPEVQPRVLPAPPIEYVGTLSIDSDPPAEVSIDRKRAGRTPLRAENLKAGSHLIWIERDGYRRFTRVVEVPADRVSRVVADLEPISQR